MPVGKLVDQRPVALAVGDVGADEAALVITGAGQCRRAGDVADRVDVLELGLVALVDLDLAAFVRLQADRSSPRSSVLPLRPLAQSSTSVLSFLPERQCSTTPSSLGSTARSSRRGG
jgi:hypothetical protein